MKRSLLAWSVGIALLVLQGCGSKAPLAPSSKAGPSGIRISAADETLARRGVSSAAAQIEGEIGPGAQYAIFRPESWNGSLVLYIHGYISPAEPVVLPAGEDIVAIRQFLLAQGFAVGYSSFSQNGYALKDGAQRTQQLRGIFASKFGQPKRVYLVGPSLGGIIAVMLAEQYPTLYSGALSMCGILGGTRRTVDYHANVRVLFDYFYPNVLPGSLLELPGGLDLNNDIIIPAVTAMQANPQGAFAMSQLEQTPIPFSNGQELVTSIVQSLVFQAIELDDFLGRTHGHSFFDNSHTVYTGALPEALLADLNARVARYTSTPDAESVLEHYYEPTGQLSVPVLALHTTLDPVAPHFNETVYHDRVASAGRLDYLVQRDVNAYGHANFTPSDIAGAFADLVRWVETGAKPSGA